MDEFGAFFCLACVIVGMVPTAACLAQYLLVGLHGIWNHYPKCADHTPRVAFILPAWNEADVLGGAIDQLMSIDYPAGKWRLYVVDDASTDHTPEVLREKCAQYPHSVVHLRREKGGQGKAHTLNHGIAIVLEENWAEAIMIMDADVLFEPQALRRMTRHLADPKVGGVTAYIKEGSDPSSLLSRFIGFEYITAQAAARRTQSLMGGLACMAGGAQLLSRDNLIAIGGKIHTGTLAEDTYTTYLTELTGHRVLFEGNAVVWAEEPDSVAALWKQRLRWARGNLQIAEAFKGYWFRPWKNRLLGSIPFGILWFSIAFLPMFMFVGATGLVGLYFAWPEWVDKAFTALWGATFLSYLFQTLFSFVIDPQEARRSWFEGIAFPGLLSLGVMALALCGLGPALGALIGKPIKGDFAWRDVVALAILGWTAISIVAAWAIYRIDKAGAPKPLRNVLLLLFGYGPLLAAISFAAIVAELRQAEAKWDKTVKTGRAKMQA